jgi:thioredoxin 1
LIVYKGGQEVDRMTGKTDPAVIEAVMRKAL